MSDIGKRVRQIALWVMCISLGVADALLFIRGQIVWGIFWAIILALVGIFEVYNFYILKKSTISNVWKAWAQASPFWAYTTLFLLWFGLNALIVHLAVW